MSNPPGPVACFGKLPFWPEYLEVGVGYPTSRALRQWLHAGREAADMIEEGEAPRDAELHMRLRLLIGLPGSTELLAGVLRPSKGAGGRHFPFTVFTHFPRRTLGKPYELLPLALAPVWEQLDDAWDSLASVASKASFDEIQASLTVVRPEPPRQVRGDYEERQARPLDGLFHRNDGASLDCLMANLPEVLDRLRARGEGKGPRVELPVSSDLDEACFDASVWIDLFNRQFFMRRFEPSLFLDESRRGVDRRVFFKFGELEPEDYSDAMGLGREGTGLLRPAHRASSTPAAIPGERARMTYAELLGSRFKGRRQRTSSFGFSL